MQYAAIEATNLVPVIHFWHLMQMRKARKWEFSVIVERDQQGFYVATVPQLPGCHTQARSLGKLMNRAREAIELCLEVGRSDEPQTCLPRLPFRRL